MTSKPPGIRVSHLAWAALLSGVLGATTWLPPWHPWALPIQFVPVFVCWIRAERARDVFVPAFLAQWVGTAIAFSWILPASQTYFDLSVPAATASWVGAASILHLCFPLIGLLWWYTRRRYDLGPVASSSLLATAWVGLAGYYPSLVPFDHGYPWLWSGLPILHLADWIGFRGLAWVTLFCNAMLALGWCSSSRRSLARSVAITAGLLAALNGVGLWHSRHWRASDAEKVIALVQPAFEASDARTPWTLKEEVTRAQELLALSAASHARTRADAWFWPEMSVRLPLGDGVGKIYERWLTENLATKAVPILLGAESSIDGGQPYNSAILFDRKGERSGVYYKEQLFPFGEYIPRLGGLMVGRKRFSTPVAGAQTGVLDLEGARLGLSICFEGLFPELFRRRADEGAHILVNLSSDQAFGNTVERYQHLYMTLARAIELRRPMVRVSFSGISAVMTHQGEIIAYGTEEEVWSQSVRVPYVAAPEATVYQSWGYRFEELCLIGFGVALGLLEVRRRRRGRSEGARA